MTPAKPNHNAILTWSITAWLKPSLTASVHTYVSKARFYPSLQDRQKNDLYPKHLQLGVSFDDEIAMHFHTAGTDAIWMIPVTEAAKNKRLVQGLTPEDALQVGLYYQMQISKSRNKQLLLEIDKLNEQVKNLS